MQTDKYQKPDELTGIIRFNKIELKVNGNLREYRAFYYSFKLHL